MGGIVLLCAVSSRAEVSSASLEKELSYQLVKEVKQTLKTPLLKYKDKDLKGAVSVTVTVGNDGKISFLHIHGVNKDLSANVTSKLNALNLWTDTRLAGKIFKYDISFV